MSAEILPSVVILSDAWGDRSDAALVPEEESVVASASERRCRAFTAGRACARNALADPGLRSILIPSEMARHDGMAESLTVPGAVLRKHQSLPG